jgi:hypothetical protein
VIITVVAIIARTIKINASLSGFGAICSPPGNKPEVARGTLRAETGELCELLHTSLVCPKNARCGEGGVPITLRFVTGDPVTRKSQPRPGLAAGAFSLLAVVGGPEAQAIFFRRRHQPISVAAME